MKVTIGRIVHYVLTQEDADQINRRRTNGASIAARIQDGKWPLGAQAHIGNTVTAGEVVPAMAVGIFSVGDDPPVNLQAFLDGNDTYWATSRHEGTAPGTWHWPARE